MQMSSKTITETTFILILAIMLLTAGIGLIVIRRDYQISKDENGEEHKSIVSKLSSKQKWGITVLIFSILTFCFAYKMYTRGL